MTKFIRNISYAALMLFGFSAVSCVGDLDVTPIDPNVSATVNIDGLFNKCYGNFVLAGNGGANGDVDIDGLDGGTTGFVRQMFNANELTTDEAICGWSDEGISSFCFNSYDASHPMLKGYYARITTGITYCNQYLSLGDADQQKNAEIRFIRAFDYSLLLDAWGNPPFSLEVGKKPVQYTSKQLFDWLIKELTEIEPMLADAKAKKSTDAGYGRVDKAAAWLLLARLYLNAEVYTGEAHWQDAETWAEKVITSPYKLNTKSVNGWSAYQMLFMGDNGETDAAYEAIFPLLNDGLVTTSWGCSEFVIAGCFADDMFANPNNTSGTNGLSGQSWGGNRARPDLVKKFFPNGDAPSVESYKMPQQAGDDRAIFWGKDRTLNVEKVSDFKSGFSVAKFVNWKSDGSAGHDATFADMDFFLMRAAEAYLTYAEADARLNGGKTTAKGTEYINALRSRAHATTRTDSYSLSNICDEWSREFYFEGRRRMDLIRFNRYGGSNGYNWQWKGGAYAGTNFQEYRNVFAIPSQDLTANKNLKQNPGY